MPKILTIATGYKAKIIVDNKLRTCTISWVTNDIVTLKWKNSIYWRHRDQLLPPG